MDPDYTLAEAGTLWRISGYFRGQIVTPAQKYYLNNHQREPIGLVGCQLTVSGSVLYKDDSGVHTVPAGSAFLHTFGDGISYYLPADATENYVCDWITFLGAGLPEHMAVLRRGHGSIVTMNKTMLQTMWDLMELAAPDAATDNTVVAHEIHDFVMNLFANFRRQKQQGLTAVDAAIEELLRHPMYPWSLKELADKYGCSREHLTRVFARRVGASPGVWLKRSRVQKAMELLRQTDLPVSSIAEKSGFASTHTLARRLRQETGKSPRALRK